LVIDSLGVLDEDISGASAVSSSTSESSEKPAAKKHNNH